MTDKSVVNSHPQENDKPKVNLHSTVNQVGKTVTQIIHFSGGNKRTFENIVADSIKQGEFTKMWTIDGRMIMINTLNVDCIEVFAQNNDE